MRVQLARMFPRLFLALLSIGAIASSLAQARTKLPRHDAAVEAIMVPSNDPRYSDLNPAVHEPRFILRNKGADPLRGISVRYGTEGYQPRMFAWTGLLGSGASIVVQLPHLIDMQPGANTFTITLGQPNGKRDANKADNTRSTTFTAAPILDGRITARWHIPAGVGGALRIENTRGPMPLDRAWSAGADTAMSESLQLPVGSYVLHLMDSSRTAHPRVRLLDAEGRLLAVLHGKGPSGARFQFKVDAQAPAAQGLEADAELIALPGRGQALVDAYASDACQLVANDDRDQPVLRLPLPPLAHSTHRIDLSGKPPGSYVVMLLCGGAERAVGRIELQDGGPR